LQNESESTQDDHVQSTTQYYVYEPRYEHVTTRVHRLSETNMEAKVVCLVNPTQKLKAKTNSNQELVVETIEV
jgi:hypothetical protein